MNTKSFRLRGRKKNKLDIIDENPQPIVTSSIVNNSEQDDKPNETIVSDIVFYDEDKTPNISIETQVLLMQKLKQLNNDLNETKELYVNKINNINKEHESLIVTNDMLKEKLYLFHICMIIITLIETFIVACFALR
jgi:hypothetical protein